MGGLERNCIGQCAPPPANPECFYKYRPDIINQTFHCAAFLCATIPYQMLSFYGIGPASKALYDFKSVVKYFQEARIKEISFCDRLCWLCKGAKYKKNKFVSLLTSNKNYSTVCAWTGGGILNECNKGAPRTWLQRNSMQSMSVEMFSRWSFYKTQTMLN